MRGQTVLRTATVAFLNPRLPLAAVEAPTAPATCFPRIDPGGFTGRLPAAPLTTHY